MVLSSAFLHDLNDSDVLRERKKSLGDQAHLQHCAGVIIATLVSFNFAILRYTLGVIYYVNTDFCTCRILNLLNFCNHIHAMR